MNAELRRAIDIVGAGADVAVRAPGRANLIGEHTDYNGGLVLPVALEMSTYVAGRRQPSLVRLRSREADGEAIVDLRTGEGPETGWGRYVTAVVRSLEDAGVEMAGIDGVVASDVPVGAGLSSSAALEVAIALAVAKQPLSPLDLARVCRRAENKYVGVTCGIMDQLTSTSARAGHALFIDCADESTRYVPLPRTVSVVLIDSGTDRSLGHVAYNERLAECRAAATALGVSSLRQLAPEDLEARAGGLDRTLFRRARHVVGENARVTEVVRALEAGALDELKELFAASHVSLARDFEVSTPELDLLVALASDEEGVLASRLTGAGFGGCTVNIVEASAAEAAATRICARFERETGRRPRYWLSAPGKGAELLTLRKER